MALRTECNPTIPDGDNGSYTVDKSIIVKLTPIDAPRRVVGCPLFKDKMCGKYPCWVEIVDDKTVVVGI